MAILIDGIRGAVLGSSFGATIAFMVWMSTSPGQVSSPEWKLSKYESPSFTSWKFPTDEDDSPKLPNLNKKSISLSTEVSEASICFNLFLIADAPDLAIEKIGAIKDAGKRVREVYGFLVLLRNWRSTLTAEKQSLVLIKLESFMGKLQNAVTSESSDESTSRIAVNALIELAAIWASLEKTDEAKSPLLAAHAIVAGFGASKPTAKDEANGLRVTTFKPEPSAANNADSNKPSLFLWPMFFGIIGFLVVGLTKPTLEAIGRVILGKRIADAFDNKDLTKALGLDKPASPNEGNPGHGNPLPAPSSPPSPSLVKDS